MFAKYKAILKEEEAEKERANKKYSRKLKKRLTWYEIKGDKPGIISIGVDLGSSASGYAYSFHRNFDLDPTKITAPSWAQDGKVAMKTPLSVLLDKDKRFVDFGFAAEDKYSEALEDEEEASWYMFRNFKNQLLEALKAGTEPTVSDVRREVSLPAMDLLSAAISYLSRHFTDNLTVPFEVDKADIFMVFTIPTLYLDTAKDFYLNAAKQAGLQAEQVLLVSEAEAVLRYCRADNEYFPAEVRQQAATVMVLDIGRDSTNITLFQRQGGGVLKQCHTSRLEVGSINIAFALQKLLLSVAREIVKEGSLDFDLLNWMAEVEHCMLSLHDKSMITMMIPVEIFTAMRGKSFDLTGTRFDGKVKITADKIRFASDLVKEAVTEVILDIEKSLKELFKQSTAYNPDTIVVVGGVARAPFVQECLGNAFPEKNICVSDNADTIVLKGAVIYGHEVKTNQGLAW